ncbi:hypothetical protein [Clostridium botulinum]|uniref:hypothetical protein n=1 Tax=Clostridium botulinum TaxID=1491 RepID=UPI001C9A6A84|nr:hypothetical protein [Clostridium botulinum]MBY6916011.1 hypothetical protein [Clostridium botulinum]
MSCLRIGEEFIHKNNKFEVVKISRNYFLAEDEFKTTIKRFPIFNVIKGGE